jgi:glutaminyl-peptide cyclotransferase
MKPTKQRRRAVRRRWKLPVFLLAMASVVAVALTRGDQSSPVRFDGQRAFEHVRHLVDFGPRPPGSAALERSRQYIVAELRKAGVTVREQSFVAQTPLGPIPMVNVIGTIPGKSPDRLLFGGHYDTKLYKEFDFVGANDGGSSTAFLIELARVLKPRQNQFTIELVFFDGEEALVEWRDNDHTYGSRHFVEAARRDGSLSTIKALVLVDMIGDRDLNIRREQYSTRWLTDIIWASARKLKLDRYFLDEYMYIEDDHIPFLQAGIPAVNVIDLDYEPWHTAEDTLDKVSAESLDIVGRVLLDALPSIEARLAGK